MIGCISGPAVSGMIKMRCKMTNAQLQAYSLAEAAMSTLARYGTAGRGIAATLLRQARKLDRNIALGVWHAWI